MQIPYVVTPVSQQFLDVLNALGYSPVGSFTDSFVLSTESTGFLRLTCDAKHYRYDNFAGTVEYTEKDLLELLTPTVGAEPEDVVNSPKHYMLFPDAEAIDIIQRALTKEEFRGYLKGNILKYRLRAGAKDDTLVDISKSEWYGEYLRKVSREL